MTPDELRGRTKAFAVRVVRFVDDIATSPSADMMARQLMRCGTSVGANDRAACLGRSKAEFAAKLQITYEEADESIYWLDVLKETEHSSGQVHDALRQEALELTKIFLGSLKTTRASR